MTALVVGELLSGKTDRWEQRVGWPVAAENLADFHGVLKLRHMGNNPFAASRYRLLLRVNSVMLF